VQLVKMAIAMHSN